MVRVTCLIRDRQLRFYGHLARFPADDPAHRILSARDPVGWARLRGRPGATWLSQLDGNLGDAMGPAQAWTTARRRPGEWKRRVDAAKCHPGACPHT